MLAVCSVQGCGEMDVVHEIKSSIGERVGVVEILYSVRRQIHDPGRPYRNKEAQPKERIEWACYPR